MRWLADKRFDHVAGSHERCFLAHFYKDRKTENRLQ